MILDGELQTVNFKKFFNYFSKKNSDKESLILDENVKINKNAKDMIFLGRDKDGGYYWSRGYYRIVVFNRDGFLIKSFKYDHSLSNTTPAVSPDGDIYFMKHEKEKMSLYRIKRQW